MITDEEHREIAQKLRKQLRYMRENEMYEKDLDVLECGNRTYRNIACSVKDCGNFTEGNYANIVELLADLIDRQTCFDTESRDSKSFTCSACGFSESKLVVNPFTLVFSLVKPSYRYCPKCGAEVVVDED